MMQSIPGWRYAAVALLAASAAAVSIGCGSGSGGVQLTPPPTVRPDDFLMERGTDALQRRRWNDAREYFGQIIDNYPQSPHRPEAKLGRADAFMGEGGTESLLRAATEYREFLTLWPTNERADRAQFQLAMSSYRQMRAPGRDQTETIAAVRAFETFRDRYPNSPLLPEALERWREARDRLSEHNYRVGLHYYRTRTSIPGAVDRFREVLRDDPQFTNRDAVYFHLAEALALMGRSAEALPYYQMLVDQFAESEYLADARKRMAELSASR